MRSNFVVFKETNMMPGRKTVLFGACLVAQLRVAQGASDNVDR